MLDNHMKMAIVGGFLPQLWSWARWPLWFTVNDSVEPTLPHIFIFIFRINREDEQSPSHLLHFSQTLSNPERLCYLSSNTLTLSLSSLVKETYRFLQFACNNTAHCKCSEQQHQMKYLLDLQLCHSGWGQESHSPQLQEEGKRVIVWIATSFQEAIGH